MNYLLLFGLALFSSAGGALAVTLFHTTRSERIRTRSSQGTRVTSEKASCE
jgi:hypothetical protein